MQQKKLARARRGRKTRAQIKRLGAVRLSVHRTSQHIYAQVLGDGGAKVLASASSLEGTIRAVAQEVNKVEIAKKVGQLVAERARQKGVVKTAFDRSGFAYHGRVKALAEAAREAGLEF